MFKKYATIYSLATVLILIFTAAQIGFWVGLYKLLFEGTFHWYLPVSIAVVLIHAAIKEHRAKNRL